ncbi:MAG: FHA domain-containing protein, partial [Bradymonadaceae bacterium]
MASFWLEYEQNGALQRFPFDAQSISIGRDKSSDFVLDHPTVSRQHALIVTEGGGVFRLIVLSRGGLTALEGQPVQNDTELYDEALLHIGRLSFRFRSDHAPPRPAHQARPPSGSYPQPGGPTPGFG